MWQVHPKLFFDLMDWLWWHLKKKIIIISFWKFISLSWVINPLRLCFSTKKPAWTFNKFILLNTQYFLFVGCFSLLVCTYNGETKHFNLIILSRVRSNTYVKKIIAKQFSKKFKSVKVNFKKILQIKKKSFILDPRLQYRLKKQPEG